MARMTSGAVALGSGVVRRPKARACTRCDGPNYEQGFSYCVTCRALTAATHQAWREYHRESGLCTECCERRKKGEYVHGPAHARGKIYMKCAEHLEYHRAFTEAHRKASRKAGTCVWYGCPVKTPHYYCDYHGALARMEPEQRAAARARAQELQAQKAKPGKGGNRQKAKPAAPPSQGPAAEPAAKPSDKKAA